MLFCQTLPKIGKAKFGAFENQNGNLTETHLPSIDGGLFKLF